MKAIEDAALTHEVSMHASPEALAGALVLELGRMPSVNALL
jgi:hypothetical protein